MSARPLDQILPARYAVAWISWRGRTLPLMKKRLERARRALELAAIWLAAVALVLGYLALCAWLDAADAQARLETSNVRISQLEQENLQLRSAIAERDMTGDHKNVFYLVESDSLGSAAAKLQRAAVSIAGEAFDLKYPGESHK